MKTDEARPAVMRDPPILNSRRPDRPGFKGVTRPRSDSPRRKGFLCAGVRITRPACPVSRFFAIHAELSLPGVRRPHGQGHPSGDEGEPAQRGDRAEGRDPGEREDIETAGKEQETGEQAPGGGRGATGKAGGQRPERYGVNQVVKDGGFPGSERSAGGEPVVQLAVRSEGAEDDTGGGEPGGQTGQGGCGHETPFAMDPGCAMMTTMKSVAISWLAGIALAVIAPAQEGPVTTETFDALPAGPPPDSLMVVEGGWAIAGEAGARVLELQAEPVVDAAILIGPSLKEGAAIRTRVRAARSRRAYPSLGVGLYGISGVKVRLVPARKTIELLVGEDVVAQGPFAGWTEDVWWQVELRVVAGGETWTAEARVWADGGSAPAAATLAHRLEAAPGSGRASLIGAPYANKPVHFDDVTVTGGK